MSLASFPPKQLSYKNDTSCNPSKAALNFQRLPTECLCHQIDSIPAAGQRPKARRMIPKFPKAREKAESEVNARKSSNEEFFRKFKDEFREKGNLKSLANMVEHRVKCAAMSTDHLLHEKRTRLRELILSEEVAYATEYVAMCQQANANREEELYKRALELKAKTERERKQFVEESLFKQKVLSCDPLRAMITQKQLKEVKQDQLWQIKEKYAKEEAQREEDKMYHDLMIKNLLSMKEDEEEIAKLEKMKQEETKEMFLEQIKWKEKKAEEERRIKEFEKMQLEEEMRLLKEEEAKEKEERLLKSNKMKAELQQCIEQERARKERRKREEEEIERTFNELLKLEAEREKMKENTKEKLKKEMNDYLENSRELKRKQEEEEKLFDKMLLELNEKKRQQKDAERRRLREAKEELFHSVLKIREEQVKEKRERQKREAEAERAEIELLTLQLEQQDKIRKEYDRKCAEQRREYQCQLMKQMQEVEEEKRRKKEEEKMFVQSMKEKEEREKEEINVILNSVTAFPLDHPMKTYIKENPPKYPCLHPYM